MSEAGSRSTECRKCNMPGQIDTFRGRSQSVPVGWATMGYQLPSDPIISCYLCPNCFPELARWLNEANTAVTVVVEPMTDTVDAQ